VQQSKKQKVKKQKKTSSLLLFPCADFGTVQKDSFSELKTVLKDSFKQGKR